MYGAIMIMDLGLCLWLTRVNINYRVKKVMRQKRDTTHIRITTELKEEINRIAQLEQRDQIVILTRMLTSPEYLPVAIAKSDEVAA